MFLLNTMIIQGGKPRLAKILLTTTQQIEKIESLNENSGYNKAPTAGIQCRQEDKRVVLLYSNRTKFTKIKRRIGAGELPLTLGSKHAEAGEVLLVHT